MKGLKFNATPESSLRQKVEGADRFLLKAILPPAIAPPATVTLTSTLPRHTKPSRRAGLKMGVVV